MLDRTLDRERRHAAEPAQRPLEHGVTEIFQQRQVALAFNAAQDFIDDFDATGRADPARRAFATGLHSAELHRITSHPRHVDGVVKHYDTSMTQQRADGRERLIVDQHIELRSRNESPQRAANLDRADRPAGRRAATVVVQQLSKAHTECPLDQATAFDVAGQLQWQRAARTTHAEILVEVRTLVKDGGHAPEGHDVVDYCGLAEQAHNSRQRRTDSNLATPAFETLEHRGLLAAHVSAGAEPDFEVESLPAAEHVRSQVAGLICRGYGGVESTIGVWIFSTQVDVTLRGAHGHRGDRHPFNETEGISLHQHTIGERTRI